MMNNSVPRAKAASWRKPAVVIVAGCLIAAIGFGARSSMGLYLEPMTTARGFSRETFGLALALQNLFWGIGLPFAGAAADRFGASRVIVIGALVYAIGLWGTAQVETGATLYLFAGILMGLGVAFSAFSLALAAMVRAIGPERRSLILGLGTAAASAGQVVFSPISQGLIGTLGWPPALAITSMLVLAMIPLALVLPHLSGSSATTARLEAEQTLRQALAEAFAHRGFVLLSTGFFVCGFHVAFITVHFPASQDTFSILLFAAVMGVLVLWLSTVPLTTGIIADVFGVRFMATLFGIVFLSHQIGSFLGVWLGGMLYDRTGSYDGMWWAGAVLSSMLTTRIEDALRAR